MAIRQKPFVTLKLLGTCTSPTRTEVSARDVGVIIDEPLPRGGTNSGPTPTETLMAALAGCANVITHKIAESHGVNILDLSIEIEALLDRRGVTLAEELDVPFPTVTQRIRIVTDASDGDVEKIKRDLPRFCPVSKVISQSGTVLTTEWTVERP